MNPPNPAGSGAKVGYLPPERRRLWVRHVLAHADLTPAHKAVLVALETYADYRDGTNAYPGIELLARSTNLGVRIVRYALLAGRRLGLIEQTAPANPNRGRAAVYRLLPVEHTGTTVPVETVDEPDHTGTLMPVRPVDNPDHTGTTVPVSPVDQQDHSGTYVPSIPAPPCPPPTPTPTPSGVLRTGVRHQATDLVAPHTNQRPSRFCAKHPLGTPNKCPDCANARTHQRAWDEHQAANDLELAQADDVDRQRRRHRIDNCPHCDDYGRLDNLAPCTHPVRHLELAHA